MRCFKISSNEIVDKISVETYYQEYKLYNDVFKRKELNVKRVIELIYDIKDGAHKTPVYHEDGIKFVMSNNVKTDGIDFENVRFISKNAYYKLINSAPKSGDILFTKVGAKFGISAVVPIQKPVFTIFVSTSVLKEIDKSEVLPEYLSIYLNSDLTRMQIDEMVKGIGVPDLHLEQIEQIKVIIPEKCIQKEIVEECEILRNKKKFYLNRKKKIEKAFENILYEKIKMDTKDEGKSKYFKIYGENIKGRQDVAFYQKSINSKKCAFPMLPLSKLCWNISSGQRPKGGVKYSNGTIPNLGGEHLVGDGRINYSKMKFIDKEFYKKRTLIKIYPMDILICKDGATTGKVALVTNDFKYKLATINEHLLKISLLEDHNPYYVFSFLNSEFGQNLLKHHISGGAQGGIIPETLDSMFIPIPDNKIQSEIERKFIQKEKLIDKVFEITEMIEKLENQIIKNKLKV